MAPEESAEEELGPGPKQQTVSAHRAQVLLGRAALRGGDIEEAKQHLLASATVGPLFADMTLARELLSRGERETVRDHLRRLARADGANAADLNLLGSWIKTIDGGGMPDFNPGAPIARRALLPR